MKMKTIPKMKRTQKNEGDPKNENDPKVKKRMGHRGEVTLLYHIPAFIYLHLRYLHNLYDS